MNIEEIISLQDFPEIILEQCQSQPVVLFGAGGGCAPAIQMFRARGIKILAIADNNSSRWGERVEGVEIASLGEILRRYENFRIFVSAPNNAHEIIPELRERDTGKEIIFFDSPDRLNREEYKSYLRDNASSLEELYEGLGDEFSKETMVGVLKGWVSGDFRFFEKVHVDDQYFVDDIIQFGAEEVFLDIGAFDGDTVAGFRHTVGDVFRGIIAIEPNPDCFEALSSLSRSDDRISFIGKGIYSRAGRFSFSSNGVGKTSQFSLIPSDSGVEVDTVDSLVEGPITFLKMDIEGLELDALRGARRTIERFRPKLAICVYHKHDDLLKISRFIQALGLGYRFYLRHHTFYCGETVLYAV